jgi:hypothetical protein
MDAETHERNKRNAQAFYDLPPHSANGNTIF